MSKQVTEQLLVYFQCTDNWIMDFFQCLAVFLSPFA